MTRIMNDIKPLAATRKGVVSADQLRRANQADTIYDELEDLRIEMADEIREAAQAEGEYHDAMVECMLALRKAAETFYKARCAYRHALQEWIIQGGHK